MQILGLNAQTAIIACMVDFQKAFNRQNHAILITKSSDMGVPSWLLHIVIAKALTRLIFDACLWSIDLDTVGRFLISNLLLLRSHLRTYGRQMQCG